MRKTKGLTMIANADFESYWGLGNEPLCLRDDPPARVYDLEERTALFGEAVIRFARKIPQNAVNNRLIDQLVGASTSVGANFCEADDGYSLKEYAVRISTCRKEARETKFFLRMVATAEPDLKGEARLLWREARELHLIFKSIFSKVAPDRMRRIPKKNPTSPTTL